MSLVRHETDIRGFLIFAVGRLTGAGNTDQAAKVQACLDAHPEETIYVSTLGSSLNWNVLGPLEMTYLAPMKKDPGPNQPTMTRADLDQMMMGTI